LGGTWKGKIEEPIKYGERFKKVKRKIQKIHQKKRTLVTNLATKRRGGQAKPEIRVAKKELAQQRQKIMRVEKISQYLFRKKPLGKWRGSRRRRHKLGGKIKACRMKDFSGNPRMTMKRCAEQPIEEKP